MNLSLEFWNWFLSVIFDVSNLCGVSSYFLPQCEKGDWGA